MGMNRIEHIFTERFVPLYPRLYSAACAILGDRRGDAQDAVQEAMVRIWRSGDAMASVQNPEAYSMWMLRRTAVDILRRRSSLAEIEPDRGGVSMPEPDSVEFIGRIVDSLPEGQREVVRLSAFDERSNEEIAELTGYSPGNVRQLLSRGRKKIREMYIKYMES